MYFLIIFASLFINIHSIWPPEYKVELKQEEEFIISELLERSDVQDIYDEEEMIQREDLKTLKMDKTIDSEKYFRLHQQSKRGNIEINKELLPFDGKNEDISIKKSPEFNPDKDAPRPWIGGFVYENNNFKKDDNMIYFDDEAKSNKTISEKLYKRNATENEEYNYENLKQEYNKEVKNAETKNDTLKYKDVKEDESPKEAIKTLAEFTPENCTEEEKSGIGFAAIKCFWEETRYQKLNKNKKTYILKKVLLIIILWFLIYLAIALPLWCQYGWCCCCCRFKFCQPRNQIEEVKTFFANNPPGIHHDKMGTLLEYKPTIYEIYAYKKLGKEIQRL